MELLRRADLVDALPALCRGPLPAAWLRELFAEIPRAGLYRMIGGVFLGMLRTRPRTVPRIFLPPRAGR